MTDIFETSGRIRADIDTESIQPDRRTAFAALVAAQAQCDQAEADERRPSSELRIARASTIRRGALFPGRR